MGYIVGTDEAGYAPNIGPLVITATVWSAPGDPREVDLYELLSQAVAKTLEKSSRRAKGGKSPASERVVFADSKLLYRPPDGIGQLELGVLAALALAGKRPATWRDVWRSLDGATAERLDDFPWHADYERSIPAEADPLDIRRRAAGLAGVAEANGVKLVAIRSRAVFADQWNTLTAEHNKSTALSMLTLELLSQVLTSLPPGPVAVICDKHGGRNFYQALLQRHVAASLVEVYGEGRSESVYRWGPEDCRTEVAFRVKAERYLPCAVASMASKYLRELSMHAFNQFWSRHVPELRPTAGYPLDAVRFKADIAAKQAALGISDHILWRNR